MSNDPQGKLDSETCLPHGEQLRVLLGSDHITYGEIASVLRKKGVFCSITDKSQTIPVLASAILKPEEFCELMEASVSRESTPKLKEQSIELTSENAEWVKALKEKAGDLVQLAQIEKMHGVTFVRNPELRLEGKKTAVISYVLNRRDYSRDLLGRDLDFNAELVISQKGSDVVLSVTSNYTSKETDKINSVLVAGVTKHFKDSGISKKEDPLRILFESFSHKNRVTFLLRLASGFHQGSVPGKIIDITIRRNEGLPLPEDPEVKWMDGKVRNMKMDGDQLNNVIMLSSEKYYNFFFITKIVVEHEFRLPSAEGSCMAVYQFQQSRSPEKLAQSEFTFQIERLSVKGAASPKVKDQIRREVQEAVREKMGALFQELRLVLEEAKAHDAAVA